jgi:elongation factor P
LGEREDEDQVEEELERHHSLPLAEGRAQPRPARLAHSRHRGKSSHDASLPCDAVISTNQFKNGTHIEVDGKVFRIVEFQHVKPGKGGAFVRSKLKRVEDGAVIDKTFKAGEKFRPVRTETRKMQFLYESGDNAVFMDNSSYEQAEIPKAVVGEALKWVPPNSEVDLLFVDERPAGAQPPSAVELTVTQTDPGLKGDTASGGGSKPATLETGVVVQVPLFIDEGERVRVDTRSGEYVSRA